jgi:hypothetical protein
MKRNLWVKVTVAAMISSTGAIASGNKTIESNTEVQIKNVLSLLNSKIEGEGSESKPCISDFKSKGIIIKS